MFCCLMYCIILTMIKHTHRMLGKEAEVFYYYLTVTLNYSNLEIIYGTEGVTAFGFPLSEEIKLIRCTL